MEKLSVVEQISVEICPLSCNQRGNFVHCRANQRGKFCPLSSMSRGKCPLWTTSAWKFIRCRANRRGNLSVVEQISVDICPSPESVCYQAYTLSSPVLLGVVDTCDRSAGFVWHSRCFFSLFTFFFFFKCSCTYPFFFCFVAILLGPAGAKVICAEWTRSRTYQCWKACFMVVTALESS